MSTSGQPNALVPGLNVINLESQNATHVLYPIDGPGSFTGIIKAYNPETGRVIVNHVWDIGPIKKDFHCAAEYQGQEGIPTESEVQIGRRCRVDRVGQFNSTGDGAPTGYELYQEDQNKVSWVIFFLNRRKISVPVSIWCSGPFPHLTTPVSGQVITTRQNPQQRPWVRTGIRQLKAWTIFANESNSFGNATQFSGREVICLDTDAPLVVAKNISTSCTVHDFSQRVFSLGVTPGQLSSGEEVLIFEGDASLSAVAVCCNQ